MWKMREAYKDFVRKSAMKKQPRKHNHIWEDDIMTNMTVDRQRFGKHHLKAGIMEPERRPLLSNGSVITFPLQRMRW
jgi:hypothetical protein